MTGEGERRSKSIRTRLDELARKRGDDVQLVLTRYANERVLARLASSSHADRFVLKGAALFTAWTGEPHRATRDLDLLGHGSSEVASFRGVFTEVLGSSVEPDGVEFEIEGLQVGPIREDQEYGGTRVVVIARIAKARIRVQIDIGFGDAVTPGPERLEFPALLDGPGPVLWTYPRSTVVAEKLEALVQLGLANSRMKDFFDLVALAERFPFDGAELVTAVRATFERRGTELPARTPVALTREFADDTTKRTQWVAFVRKYGIQDPRGLEDMIGCTAAFALEPLTAAADGREWRKRWSAGGPWVD